MRAHTHTHEGESKVLHYFRTCYFVTHISYNQSSPSYTHGG